MYKNYFLSLYSLKMMNGTCHEMYICKINIPLTMMCLNETLNLLRCVNPRDFTFIISLRKFLITRKNRI